jgi:hypothetical protein
MSDTILEGDHPRTVNRSKRPHYQNSPTFYQNAHYLPKRLHFSPKRPHFLPKRPTFFSKINHYKKNMLCDSNVYKCLPTIRVCSNILFLFYYIFINIFIKVINLINDDCI